MQVTRKEIKELENIIKSRQEETKKSNQDFEESLKLAEKILKKRKRKK